MAAKRKGGLKLNAICAKLSRQVVVEKGAEAGPQPEGSPLRPPCREAGVARGVRSEEDKRRAVIEKWVNGEYSEEPAPAPSLGRIGREGLELPPEGVYMVQPQGCSDEEDHGEEPPRDGGGVAEEKESDGAASKDDSGPSTKQASGRCLKPRTDSARTDGIARGAGGEGGAGSREGVGGPQSLPASPTRAPCPGTSSSPARPGAEVLARTGKTCSGWEGSAPGVSRAGGGCEHGGPEEVRDGCADVGPTTDHGTVSPPLHHRSLQGQPWSHRSRALG